MGNRLLLSLFLFFFLFSIPTLAVTEIADWSFEDGTGSIATDSVGNNDCDLINATFGSTSKFGSYGVEFDSSQTSYLSCQNTTEIDFDSDFSIALWIKTIGNGQSGFDQDLLGKCSAPDGFTEPCVSTSLQGGSGIAGIYISNESDTLVDVTNTNVSDGSWHFLTVTRSGNNVSLFVDSVFVDSGLIPGGSGIVTGTWNLTFGYYGVQATYYNGSLDSMKIYSGVLTQDEIDNLYQYDSLEEPSAPTGLFLINQGINIFILLGTITVSLLGSVFMIKNNILNSNMPMNRKLEIIIIVIITIIVTNIMISAIL
jgi:hypothetical protein